jgi:hypothetical protein
MARQAFAALAVVAALTTWPSDAFAHLIGCPPGQAIRGINLVTHKLVCIGVGASEQVAALEAAVATLQGQVAALEAENAAQAAAIATLQGEVDDLQAQTTFSSPSGNYFITLADTGITLQGPGGFGIQLTNDPGSVPTVEVVANDVLVEASRNIALESGLATSVQSQGNTTVMSSGQTSVTSSGIMSLQGFLLQLNGGCLPVARMGDPIVNGVIDATTTTVSSC